MSVATEPLTVPVQPRARQTFEALLTAAQEILAESGYDGLTSNAIVARAGLTPPSFYRYFSDKHMVLGILARRLLDAQNALMDEHLRVGGSFTANVDAVVNLMTAELKLTQAFPASLPLMVLLRSLPELRQLRIEQYAVVSRALAAEMAPHYPDMDPGVLRVRTRLATEIYYSTQEMLIETGSRDADEIIRRTAIAIESAISAPG